MYAHDGVGTGTTACFDLDCGAHVRVLAKSCHLIIHVSVHTGVNQDSGLRQDSGITQDSEHGRTKDSGLSQDSVSSYDMSCWKDLKAPSAQLNIPALNDAVSMQSCNRLS